MKKNRTIKDIYNTKLFLLTIFVNSIFACMFYLWFAWHYSIFPAWCLVFNVPCVLMLCIACFIENSLNKKYIKEVIFNEEENDKI